MAAWRREAARVPVSQPDADQRQSIRRQEAGEAIQARRATECREFSIWANSLAFRLNEPPVRCA